MTPLNPGRLFGHHDKRGERAGGAARIAGATVVAWICDEEIDKVDDNLVSVALAGRRAKNRKMKGGSSVSMVLLSSLQIDHFVRPLSSKDKAEEMVDANEADVPIKGGFISIDLPALSVVVVSQGLL
ncbi:hypothetical protein Ddye_016599 [Dipteronia dyeriana]|uniref:Uncharacterized protein n=1 Tax=Dipteronia dyeriana TaxID=168575 RepID=A0AAD9X0L6_9ROSI|nr:hypothetical protein Ddye_016599 [Dipteronia dyeriana]